jgi:TPR repeat protein
MVIEVLPDGPGARVGIAVGDVIERIGLAQIHGFSGYIDAEADLDCDRGVAVVVWRGSARQVKTMQPVDDLAFYGRACDAGLATGCFRLAWLEVDGGAETRDEARGMELYQKACEMGSGMACAYFALHHLDDADGKAERFAMLERSCALHDPTGCTSLAFYYSTGKDGVVHDDARATRIYLDACDGGGAIGCYNVGLNYDNGRGVPVDLEVARVAYEEGCEGRSEMACENLGLLYQSGRGVAESQETAAKYFDLACRGTGFDTSDTEGCLNLGLAYRKGRGVEEDAAEAARWFADVCDRVPDPKDPDSGSNIARACLEMGEQLAAGDGISADLSRAEKMYRRACDLGLKRACAPRERAAATPP